MWLFPGEHAGPHLCCGGHNPRPGRLEQSAGPPPLRPGTGLQLFSTPNTLDPELPLPLGHMQFIQLDYFVAQKKDGRMSDRHSALAGMQSVPDLLSLEAIAE